MPGARDDVRAALEKLRADVNALDHDLKEYRRDDRVRREEQRKEWGDLLAAARIATERAIGATLGPMGDKLAKIDAMSNELVAARDERVRRATLEEHARMVRADVEVSDMAVSRRSERRAKVLAVIGPFLSAILVAVIMSTASHCK